MNSHEIEQNLKHIFEHFSKEEFIFDLLLAYGISKASVTRLKSGDFNLSKVEGEVLYKKKIFFKEVAAEQLLESLETLSKEERIVKHAPRFAILTDFKTLIAKDLKLDRNLDIPLADLPQHATFFLPLAGSEVYQSANDNEADRNAAYKMAQLYDELVTHNKEIYTSKESIHSLNIFLSRLLFCYFAEDTEIFEGDSIFTNTLVQHTNKNGSDTHLFLDQVFEILNLPNQERNPKMQDYLSHFPYVNGGLFGTAIHSPTFTAKARKILIELGDLRWNEINPDIFGSMIQAVVIPEYRSDLGMHYTSVPNILKLIYPLFLDELYEEFEAASATNADAEIKKLRKLILRISKIKFFDPACGSGNFLIITYKEIRLLEIKILQRIIALTPNPQIEYSQIKLSQFYGIEIDDFAHEMAILSLWLAEHQMNRYFEEQLLEYGKSKPILPLKQAGKIVQGNAARIDWKTVCPLDKLVGEALEPEVYIIGNPPYLGSRNQVKEQKDDMEFVFNKDYKNLDYVSIWFYKGAKYIENHNAQLAFVSTNSICQGLLVALTWQRILNEQIEIGFAHQSFKWINNAKSNAGVTVIILGLRNKCTKPKYLFKDNIRKVAKNINAYLLDGTDIIIEGKSKPLSKFPLMVFGNMPNDGGNLLFEENEYNTFIDKHPKDKTFIKKYVGGSSFINGEIRYTLFVSDKDKEKAEENLEIAQRFKKVYEHRIKSTEKSTREKAKTPNQFYFSGHQDTDSIIVPRTSSERREYIPMGFLTSETVIADSAMAIYDAQPWLFGVIHSKMHMVWVNAVGGKLKTDYRYSAKLCYNTFPFPDITLKQKENLNLYVYAILDERAKHPEKTMAQLYDPDKMPAGLRRAHQDLDKAVEAIYRLGNPFKSDTERLEFLFKLYEEMIQKNMLFAKVKPAKKTKKK